MIICDRRYFFLAVICDKTLLKLICPLIFLAALWFMYRCIISVLPRLEASWPQNKCGICASFHASFAHVLFSANADADLIDLRLYCGLFAGLALVLVFYTVFPFFNK